MQIKIRVIPKSSKNEVESEKMADGTLKVHLTVVPEKGKANELLIKLLAKHFKTNKSSIKIIKGQTSKNKIVEI